MSELTSEEKAQKIEQIIGGIQHLKAMPHVVYKIINSTSNENVSAAELERQISQDPGLAARLLTMANSSYYSLPKRVSSVRDAVMMVGLEQVREIAMNASVFDMFIGKSDKESVRRRTWWRHSIDSAAIARFVAERFVKDVDPYDAYTAGLLHYIGKIVLDQYSSQEYEKVVMVVEKGAPERLAERIVFGADHVDIGAGIAEKWQFEPNFVDAMNYEDWDEAAVCPNKLRAIISIAHYAAVYLEDANSGANNVLRGRDWMWETLGFSSEYADIIIEGSRLVLATRAGTAA